MISLIAKDGGLATHPSYIFPNELKEAIKIHIASITFFKENNYNYD